MAEPAPPSRREVVDAVRRMRLEAATANVFDSFEAAGVHGVLLKGASFADWLYPGGPARTFSDCDILVRPSDRATAQGLLRTLGFEPDLDEDEMPEWWADHATGWLRKRDGGMVDLHRTL